MATSAGRITRGACVMNEGWNRQAVEDEVEDDSVRGSAASTHAGKAVQRAAAATESSTSRAASPARATLSSTVRF